MDALNTKIKRVVDLGVIRGKKVTTHREITHNFFVNNVLIFGLLIKICWDALYDIFQKFYNASEMEASEGKSRIYHFEGDCLISDHIGFF